MYYITNMYIEINSGDTSFFSFVANFKAAIVKTFVLHEKVSKLVFMPTMGTSEILDRF